MTTFLILSGWLLAFWFAAHWYAERDRANLAEYDAAMLSDQLRAANETIRYTDDCLYRAALREAQLRSAVDRVINAHRFDMLDNFEDGNAVYYVEN